MNNFVPKGRPEDAIVDAIRIFLVSRGWFVKKTHGSMFSAGWPDLWACHRMYGHRWIEVKTKTGRYTKDQLKMFPKFCENGSGVWTMTEASEAQYKAVVSGKPNWRMFELTRDL